MSEFLPVVTPQGPLAVRVDSIDFLVPVSENETVLVCGLARVLVSAPAHRLLGELRGELPTGGSPPELLPGLFEPLANDGALEHLRGVGVAYSMAPRPAPRPQRPGPRAEPTYRRPEPERSERSEHRPPPPPPRRRPKPRPRRESDRA